MRLTLTTILEGLDSEKFQCACPNSKKCLGVQVCYILLISGLYTILKFVFFGPGPAQYLAIELWALRLPILGPLLSGLLPFKCSRMSSSFGPLLSGAQLCPFSINDAAAEI